MTAVELTIKGDVEVLRLEPGDKIVVNLHRRVDRATIEQIQEQCQAAFPGHKVVICGPEMRLSVVAEGVTV